MPPRRKPGEWKENGNEEPRLIAHSAATLNLVFVSWAHIRQRSGSELSWFARSPMRENDTLLAWFLILLKTVSHQQQVQGKFLRLDLATLLCAAATSIIPFIFFLEKIISLFFRSL